MPIHRHQKTSETVVVLRGRIVEEFYDDLDRICSETYEVSAGGPVCALNIPAGTWHTLHSLESGTVILEMKDGAYEPIKECDILKEYPLNCETPAEKEDIVSRLKQFIEDEARSCSMDPGCITPEYVYRMWGGKVSLDEIREGMKRL